MGPTGPLLGPGGPIGPTGPLGPVSPAGPTGPTLPGGPILLLLKLSIIPCPISSKVLSSLFVFIGTFAY